MTPDSIKSALAENSKDYMLQVIRNAFIKNMYDFGTYDPEEISTKSKLKTLEDSIKEFAREYSAMNLKLSLGDSGKMKADANDDLIQEGFEKYIESHEHSLRENLRPHILEAAQKACKSIITESEQLIKTVMDYKRDTLAQTKELVTQLITFANDDNIEHYLFQDQNELVVSKITALIELSILISPVESSFDFVSEVSKFFPNEREFSSPKATFHLGMVKNLLEMFTRTSRVGHIKQGKELFVNFLTDIETYDEPTEAYKKFIIKRYKRDKLRSDLRNMNKNYDRMLRILAIDVIHTSLFLDFELIDRFQLIQMFKNLDSYLKDYDPREQQIFVSLRKMILDSSDALEMLPSMFQSLYDSFLHASQYYTHGYQGLFSDSDNFAILYESYIDYMWDWENSIIGRVFNWQPDSEHFPINIKENYVFYKMMNLVNNLDHFADMPILLKEFKYQDHYWIHQFFNFPAPRMIMNYMMTRYFPQKGYNYMNLRGLELPAEFRDNFLEYKRRTLIK